MKLDLNSLLEEIHSWKTLLKAKDEEIELLHSQLTFIRQQNKTLEETQTTLLQEIAQFNNALSMLHNSVSRLENYEVEKKVLLSEKESFEVTLDEQKMLHHKEVEELEKEILSIKLVHKGELEKERSEALVKASSKVEKYLERINENENIILKLEEEISKLKSENNSETLRIKIEYEEKISKLKARLVKPKGSHSLHDDFKKDDIFRQKYIKIEKESKEEMSKLKNEVQELHSQLNSLRNNALHCNLQRILPLNEVREENVKPNGYEAQSSHLFKRLKTFADEGNDENDFTVFDMSRNQAELVKPVKKKLFNLDMNYFVK